MLYEFYLISCAHLFHLVLLFNDPVLVMCGLLKSLYFIILLVSSGSLTRGSAAIDDTLKSQNYLQGNTVPWEDQKT